ncbi:hypothetical protein HAX54_018150 [Datura stramonium]|uniref:Uncharacterized protein n=1 Tax=Datura stramonium TaxID=4076 RepID=A0ABS8S1V7_DATST|nr:hypothetical protein [Datura stramonium]
MEFPFGHPNHGRHHHHHSRDDDDRGEEFPPPGRRPPSSYDEPPPPQVGHVYHTSHVGGPPMEDNYGEPHYPPPPMRMSYGRLIILCNGSYRDLTIVHHRSLITIRAHHHHNHNHLLLAIPPSNTCLTSE